MKVPDVTAPTQTIAPAQLPLQHLDAPAQAFGGTVAGEGLQELGAAAGKASDNLAQYATYTQNIVNKQASDERGYATAQKMGAAFAQWRENNQGQQATLSLPDLQKSMLDMHTEGKQGLSPVAADMYDDLSRRYMLSFNNEASIYAAQQWREGTNKSADAAALNAADLYAKNPVPENDALLQHAAATSAAIRLGPLGLKPDDPQIKNQIVQYLSPAYAARTEQLYNSGDVSGARMFMEEHKDSLTVQAYHQLDSALRVKSQANDIHAEGHAIVTGGPVPLSADKLFNDGVIMQETGNHPGLVNPDTGVQGVGQLKPETAQEMATKLGVPWKPELMTEKTPEAAAYQRQLSRAYFDEAWQKSNGDPVRTLEYYYGGPNQKQWGPDTKKYIGDVLARTGGGQQLPPLPRDPSWTAAEYVGRSELEIDKRLNVLYPGVDNAERRYQIKQAAIQEVGTNAKILAAQQGDNFDKVENYILQNPSADVSTVKSALATEWSQLPVGYQRRLEGYTAQQNAMETPTRQLNFQGLLGLSVTDPSKFIDPTKTDIRGQELSSSERNYLMKLQANLGRNEQAKADRQNLLQKYLSDPIVAAKVKTTWPTADDKNSDGYRQFLGALDSRISLAAPDGKVTPEIVRKTAADLLSTGTQGPWWQNIGKSSTPAYEVPDAEAKSIQSQFAPKYGRQLDPEEVAKVYQYNLARRTK